MTRELDLDEFAGRVERVCDFMLSRTKGDGSQDLKVLQDLKSDAADIQTGVVTLNDARQSLTGLHDYMNGV